jgi:hypothetical protein
VSLRQDVVTTAALVYPTAVNNASVHALQHTAGFSESPTLAPLAESSPRKPSPLSSEPVAPLCSVASASAVILQAGPSKTELDPFLRLPSATSVLRAPSAAFAVSRAEPVAGIGEQTARQARLRSAQRVETVPTVLLCQFRGLNEGAVATTGTVGVMSVPPKGAIRVREKLREYEEEDAPWPLTASVLDPVRARCAPESIVHALLSFVRIRVLDMIGGGARARKIGSSSRTICVHTEEL